jgi:tetratricopeptide (TPR) repeat protein
MVGAFGEVQVMDWGLAKSLPANGRTATLTERPKEIDQGREIEAKSSSTPSAGDVGSVGAATWIDIRPAGIAETLSGAVLGTLAYMSPEQASGEIDKIDFRSDVFGLGAILCVILTGQPPYRGRTEDDTKVLAVRADLTDTYARLDNCGAEPDLIVLAKHCLAVARANRPDNAQAVLDAVRNHAAALETRAQEEHDRRVEAETKSIEGRRRRRVLATAAVLVMMALVAGIIGTTWQANQAESARADAVANEKLANDQRDVAREQKRRTRAALDAMVSKEMIDRLGSQKEMTKGQREFLHTALNYFREFATEAATDEEGRNLLAQAHLKVGDIFSSLGQNNEAAAAIRESIPIYESLTADFPSVPEYRKLVALAHKKLGNALTGSGQRAAIVVEYRAAMDIEKALADEFPGVPEFRSALAVSHNFLGNVLAEFGQLEAAIIEYRKDVDEHEKLAANFPAVPRYRFALAQSHGNLGNQLTGLGRPTAEAEFRAALGLLEKLVVECPDDSEYRRDLAQNHNHLGSWLGEHGRHAAAEAEFQLAIVAQEKLAADFPAMPHFRFALAQTRNNLGELFVNMGRRTEAEAAYRTALAIDEKLSTEFPALTSIRSDLAAIHVNLAELLANMRRRAEAEEQFQKAIDLKQRLIVEIPDKPQLKEELAKFQSRLSALKAGPQNAAEPPAPNPAKSNSAPPQQKKD